MYAQETKDLPLLSHSLQVLKIQSFKHLLEQSENNFIQQHYTNIELRVSDTGKRRIQYLAGRWAAKKAIASILEQDNMRSHCWLNIEILRLPTGQPSVALSSHCREMVTRLGIKQWFLSISHTDIYAVASVAVVK